MRQFAVKYTVTFVIDVKLQASIFEYAEDSKIIGCKNVGNIGHVIFLDCDHCITIPKYPFQTQYVDGLVGKNLLFYKNY